MNLIARLRETRPSLSFPELLAARGATTRYEGVDELRDERGDLRRYRVYSIGGHLFEGAPILVPLTKSALEADAIAEAGLADTIRDGLAALRSLADETEHTIEARPNDSAGLSGEQHAKIERMLADRH
jgi:hypothetical protein